ncbi:hypothetical protein [Asticcacaulis sp.]|uniref:hypothetical protein n=1 Tax=Asticcacaulis sp. TaxID=1872648 RepID=UPI0031E3E44E
MGKLRKWLKEPVNRWRLIALGCFAAFVGCAVARFDWSWDGATAIVGLVALVVAVVGYFDNRTAQRLEHRAYLKLEPETPCLVDDFLVSKVLVKNYGRTPADFVFIKLQWEHLTLGNLSLAGENDEVFRITRVHPGADYGCVGEVQLLETNYDMFDLWNEKYSITMKIDVTYRDVFGQRHSDKFTKTWRADRNPHTGRIEFISGVSL